MKAIDNKTKHKIFGFVRRHEFNNSVSIPLMIQYILMLHYWINEQFTEYGNETELDESKKVDNTDTPFYTEYGNNPMTANDPSIERYGWKFRINAIGADAIGCWL